MVHSSVSFVTVINLNGGAEFWCAFAGHDQLYAFAPIAIGAGGAVGGIDVAGGLLGAAVSDERVGSLLVGCVVNSADVREGMVVVGHNVPAVIEVEVDFPLFVDLIVEL